MLEVMATGRLRLTLRRRARAGQTRPAGTADHDVQGLAGDRRARTNLARRIARPVRRVPEAVGDVAGVAIDVAIGVAQNMLP